MSKKKLLNAFLAGLCATVLTTGIAALILTLVYYLKGIGFLILTILTLLIVFTFLAYQDEERKGRI